ncbi:MULTISPECIES: LacI family DNA-binding transcriptional regulator [unclassified Microbacterium]|uniref:LacI family DNA-binding transcriptional regulator n=1 Tax=unclassified Microbacterium TaxID=2609290 RepID=UPI0030167E95
MTKSAPATLKDVALRAGVHVGTASRALDEQQAHLVNEETRARVRAAAEHLGYRPNAVARSLRKGSTGVVGVIVADLSNGFVLALLRGVEKEAHERGVLPLVAETHDDPAILRSAVTRLLRYRVDAIILSAAHMDDEEYVADLESRVPVVLAVRGFDMVPGGGGDRREVLQDDRMGARMAVTHLISQGHRRIAQLAGDPRISSFVGRSRGFHEAVAAHIGVEDVSVDGHAMASTIDEGRRLAAAVLRLPPERRPTALFAHNDLMAVGAIDALREAGLRCPEDVSVVGYNDAPLSDHLDPPLTTVRLPGFELGQHSARLAFAAVAGESAVAERIMLAPEFIERKSTRAIGSGT